MARYRINYGNGQVHGPFNTKDEAVREYKAQLEYDKRHHQSSQGLHVQRYAGDGEWERVSMRDNQPYARNHSGSRRSRNHATARTPRVSRDQAIRAGMARAAFVSHWADRQEEKGRSFFGRDLMDVAPKRTSKAANRWARKVANAIVADNGNRSLTDLYRVATGYGYTKGPGTFGHYLGMQAMGHGVAWDDDVSGVPNDAIRVPGREFYE